MKTSQKHKICIWWAECILAEILGLASRQVDLFQMWGTFCILACLFALNSTGRSWEHIMRMVWCCDGPHNSYWRRRSVTLKVSSACLSRWRNVKGETGGGGHFREGGGHIDLPSPRDACYLQSDDSPPSGWVGRTIATWYHSHHMFLWAFWCPESFKPALS